MTHPLPRHPSLPSIPSTSFSSHRPHPHRPHPLPLPPRRHRRDSSSDSDGPPRGPKALWANGAKSSSSAHRDKEDAVDSSRANHHRPRDGEDKDKDSPSSSYRPSSSRSDRFKVEDKPLKSPHRLSTSRSEKEKVRDRGDRPSDKYDDEYEKPVKSPSSSSRVSKTPTSATFSSSGRDKGKGREKDRERDKEKEKDRERRKRDYSDDDREDVEKRRPYSSRSHKKDRSPSPSVRKDKPRREEDEHDAERRRPHTGRSRRDEDDVEVEFRRPHSGKSRREDDEKDVERRRPHSGRSKRDEEDEDAERRRPRSGRSHRERSPSMERAKDKDKRESKADREYDEDKEKEERRRKSSPPLTGGSKGKDKDWPSGDKRRNVEDDRAASEARKDPSASSTAPSPLTKSSRWGPSKEDGEVTPITQSFGEAGKLKRTVLEGDKGKEVAQGLRGRNGDDGSKDHSWGRSQQSQSDRRPRRDRSRSPSRSRGYASSGSYTRRESYDNDRRRSVASPTRLMQRRRDGSVGRSRSPIRARRMSRSRSPRRYRDDVGRGRADGARRSDRRVNDRSLSRGSSWSNGHGKGRNGLDTYRPSDDERSQRRGTQERSPSPRRFDDRREPVDRQVNGHERKPDSRRSSIVEASGRSTPEQLLNPIHYGPKKLEMNRAPISFTLKMNGDSSKPKLGSVLSGSGPLNSMPPPPIKPTTLPPSAPRAFLAQRVDAPEASPTTSSASARASSDRPPSPPPETPPDSSALPPDKIALPNLPVLVTQPPAAHSAPPAIHFRDFSQKPSANVVSSEENVDDTGETFDMVIDSGSEAHKIPSWAAESFSPPAPPAAFVHRPGRGNFLKISDDGSSRNERERLDGLLESGEYVEVQDPRLGNEDVMRDCLYGAGSKTNETELLQIKSYLWDEHSTGSKPPPPPEGITIIGLHHLTQPDTIANAVRKFGDIRDTVVKLHPKTGASIGICWVLFRNSKGKPPATQAAKLAKARLQGMKIDLRQEHGVKVILDASGVRADKAVLAEVQRRKEAAAPKPPPRPAAPATRPVDNERQPPATNNRSFAVPPKPAAPVQPSPPAPVVKAPIDFARQSIGKKTAPVRGRPAPFGPSSHARQPFALPAAPTWSTQPPAAKTFAERSPQMGKYATSHHLQASPMITARRMSYAHREDSDASGEDEEDRSHPARLHASPRQGLAAQRGNIFAPTPDEAARVNRNVAEKVARNGNPYLFIDKLCLPLNPDYQGNLELFFKPFSPSVMFNTSGWIIVFKSDKESSRAAKLVTGSKVGNHVLTVEQRAAGAATVAAPSVVKAKPAQLLLNSPPPTKVLARAEVKMVPPSDPATPLLQANRQTTAVTPVVIPSAHTLPTISALGRKPAASPTPSEDSVPTSESLSSPPASLSPSPPPKDIEELLPVPVASIIVKKSLVEVSTAATRIDIDTAGVAAAEIDPSASPPATEPDPRKAKSLKRKPAPSKKLVNKQGPAKKKQKRVLSQSASPEPLLPTDPHVGENPAATHQQDANGDIQMDEPKDSLAPPVPIPTDEPPDFSLTALDDVSKLPTSVELADIQALPKPKKRGPKPKRAKNATIVGESLPTSAGTIHSLDVDDEDLYLLSMAIRLERENNLPEVPVGPLEEEDPVEEVKHTTGCARTQGYYKVKEVDKSAYLPSRNKAAVEEEPHGVNAVATSRSTRVNTRRLVQGMEQHKKATAAADTDVFQFNQLRTRKKQLKFSKSPIHDWGLYAMEAIPQGEMVIEYVGEVIRAQVADIREKWYEKIGIGSSYLFRVDDDAVVDATKKGNLGRLINHCCAPNCTAKIITINGDKKIVIYAKSNIEPGEEITYDYHFPLEQEKIVCLCGSSKCRGYLN